MTNYGRTLTDVNEFIRRFCIVGCNELNNQLVKVGDECKVGRWGGFHGTFFCEPATVIKIQKDDYGCHRICVQGQKSGYKVYCKESGLVTSKRFGNNMVVVFDKMNENDILDRLYDFNK